MKANRLLLISFLLNVALSIGLFSARKQPAIRQVPPASAGSHTAQEVRPALRQNARQPTLQLQIQPLVWSALHSSNLKEYADNLRAVGCPKGTTFDIIADEIHRIFRARVRQIVSEVQDRYYEEWILAAGSITKLCEPQQEALESCDEEMKTLFEECLGSDDPPASDRTDQVRDQTALLDVMPLGTAEAVVEVRRRYARELAAALITPSSATNRAAIERVFGEREDTELRQLLTEDQLREIKLRKSPNRTVSLRMNSFSATPDEWRAMFEREAAASTAQSYSPKEMESSIAQWLGPQRGAEFSDLREESFRDFAEVAIELNLPIEVARQGWEIEKAWDKHQKDLLKKPMPESIRQALTTEQAQTVRESLARLFGSEGAEAYIRRYGEWLDGR